MRLTALVMAGVLAGCGSGDGPPGSAPTSTPSADAPAPAPRTALAARAAAAQDLVAVSFYALVTPDHPEERTVMVVRAADGGWRVDIPGGALGGTADVSIIGTGESLFQCRLPDPPEPAGCVEVDPLPDTADPRVHHVFTDWLDVLTDRSAAVAVSEAPALDGAPAGDCFSVEPSAASLVAPLDAGVYCYQPDGTLTGAELTLGTLTLVGTDAAAPPSVELPGPAAPGEPLPTASPTPSPSPTGTATTEPTQRR